LEECCLKMPLIMVVTEVTEVMEGVMEGVDALDAEGV